MSAVQTMDLARVVIINDAGQILLALRSQQTFLPGMWELPGGKLDPGENWAQAAVREVHEETGLRVTLGAQLMLHDDAFDGRPIRTMIYIAPVSGPLSPMRLRAREHADAGWFALDAIPELLTSTARAAIDRIMPVLGSKPRPLAAA